MNDPGQVGPSHCGPSRADSTETCGMFDGWWEAWASLSFVLSLTDELCTKNVRRHRYTPGPQGVSILVYSAFSNPSHNTCYPAHSCSPKIPTLHSNSQRVRQSCLSIDCSLRLLFARIPAVSLRFAKRFDPPTSLIRDNIRVRLRPSSNQFAVFI